MDRETPGEVVRRWWGAFNAGDYGAAASLLAPDSVVDWPLTGERMPSPRDWRQIKEHYPAASPWRAEIIDLVEQGNEVVSFAQVFDGSINDFAISRFTVESGQIVRLVEFWPETYAAPEWRKPWVVALPDHENPIKRDQDGGMP